MAFQSRGLLEFTAQFEDDPEMIFMLDGAYRLRYCNLAWDRFAWDNGAGNLMGNRMYGCDLLEVTPAPLRPFYTTMYQAAFRTGAAFNHEYECSSAQVYRRFNMRLKRVDVPKSGQFLIAVNSLILERPHDEASFPGDPKDLREESGLITMCAHCRRTRLPGTPDYWVWVSDFVRSMPAGVIHGLCSLCQRLYFAE